jgi:hypothetical protein
VDKEIVEEENAENEIDVHDIDTKEQNVVEILFMLPG